VTVALTLSLYIARAFTQAVLGMLAGLTGLAALFDMVELLRRSASHPQATFDIVVEIAVLRLPWIAMQILPFAVLTGSILALWRLTRSSELVVARAAGISAWGFLAAPVLCAVLLGAFATTAVTPLSAVMRAGAQALEDRYLGSGAGPLALNGGQIWLRQSDRGLDPQGVAILHALTVAARGSLLTAQQVSVFRLDGHDHPVQRIEAARAELAPGEWVLDDARTLTPGRLPDAPHRLTLPTDLTVERVQESFAPPDTLSVWALPGFIRLLDRSGFSSISHRLHFQALLALPLLCGTMCLLGAAFSLRSQRRGGVAQMLGSGVAAGFALFVISKLAEEFGQSGVLPPLLAAWAPALAGLMFSVALLLHLEDG
jgi:lipopolysaccharide export system permease protein